MPAIFANTPSNRPKPVIYGEPQAWQNHILPEEPIAEREQPLRLTELHQSRLGRKMNLCTLQLSFPRKVLLILKKTQLIFLPLNP